MAFNPNNYPEEYRVIKAIWGRFVLGEPIGDLEQFAYYEAKSGMFEHKFFTTTADHHKERIYMRKCGAAAREAKILAQKLQFCKLDEIQQAEVLNDYCLDMISTMGPKNVSKFWGS